MSDAKCEYCKGIILGQSRQISGKKYHTKCFICTGCSKELGETGWEEVNGWPWCTTGTNCYENGRETKFVIFKNEPSEETKRLKEQETKLKEIAPPNLGSISIGVSKGFTIDPKTGQKKPANKPPPEKKK